MASVESLIKKDKAVLNEKLKDCMWSHDKINRRTAESMLKKHGKGKNGAFLVRESLINPGDFVLSLMKDQKFAHFIISQRRPLHCLYSIENQQVITGLEELIQFYTSDKNNLLPCRLKQCVKGHLPPPLSLKRGYNSILHRKIKELDSKTVLDLIRHPNGPDVNMKDEAGTLAIHFAAKNGWLEVVNELINKGAEVSAPDAVGNTALHLASRTNQESVIRALVFGRASVHTRNHENGNMALHEAAGNGHKQCVQLLLSLGATAWPFNSDNKSPFELAVMNGHANVSKFIDDYVPPAAKTYSVNWDHGNIKRQEAQAILDKLGLKDGMFLVRASSKPNVAYVLQYVYKRKTINMMVFAVKSKNITLYQIQHGPLFHSIEHLVEYYCLCKDGLETQLTSAITPQGQLKPMVLNKEMEEIYMSSTQYSKVTDSGETEYMQAAQVGMSTVKPASSLKHTPSITKIIKNKFGQHVLNVKNIHQDYELGQGEFGSVMKGTWQNPNGEVVDVAIKQLHEEYHETGMQSFLAEAEVMVKLSHPCIVHFIGVCRGPPLMLVQELVVLGSLLDFLLDYPEKIDTQRDLYLWAAQIACGMMYLEQQHFVHRDLATRNILLASKSEAKVGDFGLSRFTDNDEGLYKATKGGRWPVRWYAPEAVNYGKFSHASDVWSFGVTLWEMFTFGDQPYMSMTGAEVVSYIEKGHRLEQPEKCPDNIYAVMMSCWEYDHAKRVTFRQLLDAFNDQSKKFGQHLINPGGTVAGTNC